MSGCPGAGKTTILKRIAELRPEFECVEEQLSEETARLLAKVYRGEGDAAKNGLELQFAIMARALRSFLNCKTFKKMRVRERDFSDASYFIGPMVQFGLLTEDSRKILSEHIRLVDRAVGRPQTLKIFLDADPATLRERILTRCRAGEESISLGYLTALRESHKQENWDACVDASQPVDAMIVEISTILDHFKRQYGPCPYHGCVTTSTFRREESESEEEIDSPPYSPLS